MYVRVQILVAREMNDVQRCVLLGYHGEEG